MSSAVSSMIEYGTPSAIFAGLAVYFQQHNRAVDRRDSKIIDESSSRVADTRLVLEGWKNLEEANARQTEALRGLLAECELRGVVSRERISELERELHERPA